MHAASTNGARLAQKVWEWMVKKGAMLDAGIHNKVANWGPDNAAKQFEEVRELRDMWEEVEEWRRRQREAEDFLARQMKAEAAARRAEKEKKRRSMSTIIREFNARR